MSQPRLSPQAQDDFSDTIAKALCPSWNRRMRQTPRSLSTDMPSSIHSDEKLVDEEHETAEEQDHTPPSSHGSGRGPSCVHVANPVQPMLWPAFAQASIMSDGN